jgi:hypothetical protein
MAEPAEPGFAFAFAFGCRIAKLSSLPPATFIGGRRIASRPAARAAADG